VSGPNGKQGQVYEVETDETHPQIMQRCGYPKRNFIVCKPKPNSKLFFVSLRVQIVLTSGRMRLNRPFNLLSDKCCIMSDMSSERITIRVPQTLGQRLRSRSRLKGQAESELVREALESYLGESSGERPAYELAEEAGLIGCVRRGPSDLSTDSRHFEGFGKGTPAKARARISGRKKSSRTGK
jgi:predicted DNA-binding protein